MQPGVVSPVVGGLPMFGAAVAQGRECKGVNFPEQTQVEGTTLTLNALGRRQATLLQVSVYVAAHPGGFRSERLDRPGRESTVTKRGGVQ